MAEIFQDSHRLPDKPAQPSPYPKPLDLSHHLSTLSRNRSESSIKALYKYFAVPGAKNLAGGLPNPSLFPFDTLEADVALPSRWAETPNDGSVLANAFASLWSKRDTVSHLKVNKFSRPGTLPQDTLDLATALQYSSAKGYPALLDFVTKFSAVQHKQIPYDSPDITMTCGSTDSINKVVAMLTEPGEYILMEEYAFGTILTTSHPWNTHAAPVKMDKFGLIPEALEEILVNWDPLKGRRPHVLYTISIGQNPTGGILPFERRKEIYRICRKYDLIIMEDEPYWYLQFDTPVSKSSSNTSKGYPYLESLQPSYLSIDVDGRVIRMDTFSKTICPGSRCGWITAQPLFTERILRHSESSTQAPSGFVQVMIASLLRNFGMDGWIEWISHLRDQYEHRRNVMCDALDAGFSQDDNILTRQVDSFDQFTSSEKAAHQKESEGYVHVSSKVPLCSYIRPQGGMFLWLRIGIERHPKYTLEKKRELMDELWVRLAESKVVVSPSWIFASTEEIGRYRCEYFRLCFAAIDLEDIKSASTQFGVIVRQWFADAESHGKHLE